MCRAKSTAARPWARARRASRACASVSPGPGSTKSITVVVPPQAAAIVPLSQSSLERVAPTGISRCTCGSTAPGSTTKPSAGRVRRPARSWPMAAITPSWTARSDWKTAPAVMSAPPRMTRSNISPHVFAYQFGQSQALQGRQSRDAIRIPAAQGIIAVEHGVQVVHQAGVYRLLGTLHLLRLLVEGVSVHVQRLFGEALGQPVVLAPQPVAHVEHALEVDDTLAGLQESLSGDIPAQGAQPGGNIIRHDHVGLGGAELAQPERIGDSTEMLAVNHDIGFVRLVGDVHQPVNHFGREELAGTVP